MTDKDIDKKLKKMEEQLDVITSSLASRTPDSSFSNLEQRESRFPSPEHSDPRFPSAYGRADEIDLRELFGILWQGKWWIIGVTFLFAVAGVFYAKSLPNMYSSEGVYAPAQKQGGALGGQLGGLATLAGVSLGGGESNDIEQAMVLMTSGPFLEQVINEYNLKPFIMAASDWDRSERKLIWDGEVYDASSSTWVRVPPPGKQAEPSSFEVYKQFKESIEVKKDKKTELITIGFSHVSPDVAKVVVDAVVTELNEHFRQRDMVGARENVNYLKEKIEQTSFAEMQTVFYEMIEGQLKKLMLAEVGEDYLIRSVVRPVVAEERSAPSRVLILLLAIIFGGTVSVAGVLTWQFKWGRS